MAFAAGTRFGFVALKAETPLRAMGSARFVAFLLLEAILAFITFETAACLVVAAQNGL
jgi:hypothetical protein